MANQTMQQFIDSNNIRVVQYTQVSQNKNNPGWHDANHYYVTLKRKGGKQISTYFSKGYGHSDEPQPNEILSCFALDSSGIENAGDYEDWLSEFGYEDNASGRKLYNTCLKQSERVKRWLGDDLYEELLWDTDGI